MLNKAKQTYEIESRRIKTGLSTENDRTVSRAQLNSLIATLAPHSESTVAPSASHAQNTSTSKQPHYTKTAKTFEQKQQLSSPNKEDESEDDEEPTYQAECIKSVMLDIEGKKAETFEVKWEGYPDSENTNEPFYKLSEDLKPIGRDLAAKVPQV